MGNLTRDYLNKGYPDDLGKNDYGQTERRAFLTEKLLRLGMPPKYLNKSKIGREILGVTPTTVARDLKAVAQSINEHHDRENLNVDSDLKLWIQKMAEGE